MARFANGSIGTFEATRYGVGCQNRNTFEVNGSKGMLSFTLDEMNQLDFIDATEPAGLQSRRSIAVTGLDHPYGRNFWKPGHVLGYEHPFIATLADFLNSIARQEPFHATLKMRLQYKESCMRSNDLPPRMVGSVSTGTRCKQRWRVRFQSSRGSFLRVPSCPSWLMKRKC